MTKMHNQNGFRLLGTNDLRIPRIIAFEIKHFLNRTRTSTIRDLKYEQPQGKKSTKF